MAQQSAQREPSMEEILASIRRIIEDGDAGSKVVDSEPVKPDNDPLPSAAAPAPAAAKTQAAPATVIEVNAFRSELRAAPAERAPESLAAAQPNVQPLQSIDLSAPAPQERHAAPVEQAAAVQPVFEERRPAPVEAAAQPAAVRAVPQERQAASAEPMAALPEVPAELRSPTALAEVQAQVAADQIAAREAAERDYRGTLSEVPAPVAAEPPKALRPARDWRLGVAGPEPQAQGKPAEAEQDAAIDAALEDIAARQLERVLAEPRDFDDISARPAIISDHTGRQVAAAFGELSEALASRSKQSIDDIAEEMLRPMLQDWLDNNLPLLVEKLVREEIERVARGG